MADLNGSLFDCALGITAPGTSAVSTTVLSNDTIYVLKESVALASLTAGWDGSTDAWGNTTHLNTLYDSVTSPHALGSTTGMVYWGNGSNQVIDGAGSGVAWSTAGFIPKDNNATSATGTNQFGNDYFYRYNRHNLFPLAGGTWTTAAALAFSAGASAPTGRSTATSRRPVPRPISSKGVCPRGSAGVN